MGVDVNLYVEAEPTPEELERAREIFRARCLIADDYTSETGETYWQCLDFEDDPFDDGLPPRVVVNLNSRYWSPGYERGNWPAIYGAIRLVQALFPGNRVCYAGDTVDQAEPVTPERLEAYWAHFVGPRGDDYFARYR